MLRFFRNIRSAFVTRSESIEPKLLDNNRLRLYTMYAIGEVILVMIGILLALQVNNWNEKRKTEIQKNNFSKQLIVSLQNDLAELDAYENRIDLIQEGCQYIWDYVNGDSQNIDTNLFKMNFLNAANSFEFTPNSTVYDNLVENVGLSSLKNDTLKTLFGVYYNESKAQSEVIQQRIQYAASYNDYRFEFCSTLMLKEYLNKLFNQDESIQSQYSSQEMTREIFTSEIFDLSAYKLEWDKLKASKQYKILLGRLMAIREPLYNNINVSQNRIESMMRLLKNELK